MSKSGSKLKVETLKAWLEELKRKRKTTVSISSNLDKPIWNKYADTKYKFKNN